MELISSLYTYSVSYVTHHSTFLTPLWFSLALLAILAVTLTLTFLCYKKKLNTVTALVLGVCFAIIMSGVAVLTYSNETEVKEHSVSVSPGESPIFAVQEQYVRKDVGYFDMVGVQIDPTPVSVSYFYNIDVQSDNDATKVTEPIKLPAGEDMHLLVADPDHTDIQYTAHGTIYKLNSTIGKWEQSGDSVEFKSTDPGYQAPHIRYAPKDGGYMLYNHSEYDLEVSPGADNDELEKHGEMSASIASTSYFYKAN